LIIDSNENSRMVLEEQTGNSKSEEATVKNLDNKSFVN
jgi:hypothetical protein